MKKIIFSMIALFGVATIQAQNWSLTGNAGTSSNFLGTTDSSILRFKVGGSNAGFIDPNSTSTGFGRWALDYSSGADNTAVGSSAMARNSTGNKNTAVGTNAMINNKTGSQNTAIGAWALVNNTTGGSNTGVGTNSLYTNTTGSYNTATGLNALFRNTTGAHNTAVGFESLIENTTGNYNTSIGSKALHANTTGEYNTALGEETMVTNTTGYWNVGLGSGALNNNSTGFFNTAVGTSAMWFNKTGQQNASLGTEALAGNIDGSWNTAMGTRALWSTVNGTTTTAYGHGSNNTAIGYESTMNITTGGNNTAIGLHSLINNKAGSNNTVVGMNADISVDGLNNATAIGFGAIATASNQMRFGNSSVTTIGGTVGWSVLSDGRAKKNIQQDVPGLAFINLLQPVTYNYDLDAADKIVNVNVSKTEKSSLSQNETADRAAKQQVKYTGFIAQDVEKAAKELKYDFSGVDTPKNKSDLYGLRYSEFVVPLVKAVQELSVKNNEKDSIISSLQTQIDELKVLVQRAIGNTITTSGPAQNAVINTAQLQQNLPNPFNQSTEIRYTIPQAFSSAEIIVMDMNSRLVKQIPISRNGAGSINLDAGTMPAGVYLYSLKVDGNLVATKKMILSK